MPKRTLIFSLAYIPQNVGGAEVAVKEITDRITPDNIEFDMITLNSGGELPEEKVGNIQVYRLFGGTSTITKLMYPFRAFFVALRLHKTRSYTGVWSIMASYAGYAGMLFKKIHPEVPFLLTLQEGDNFERRRGIFYLPYRSIFVSADHIQAISNFLAEWSRTMGAHAPVTVVPNGVNYERFSTSITPELRTSLRMQKGFDANDIVIITTSRLVYKNAIDILIQSLKYLDDAYKLLILGNGEEEERLKALVSQLKLRDRVHFTEFVSHALLPDYLKAADVFVRPSRSEGLGNSFLEAMAARIPVVATPVGGIPDFLIDGETGLLCEVDNPESVAQKVTKLMKDRESREYIIGQAQRMIQETYRWEGIAQKMSALLYP